ncbi:hypothetical protein STEG23_006835, partial [Scotinomys teguina]
MPGASAWEGRSGVAGVLSALVAALGTEFGKLKYVHHTIDTYSGFQWAIALSSEKADSVIMHLLEVMAIMGIPAQIKTDNAPAYVSAVQIFIESFIHVLMQYYVTFESLRVFGASGTDTNENGWHRKFIILKMCHQSHAMAYMKVAVNNHYYPTVSRIIFPGNYLLPVAHMLFLPSFPPLSLSHGIGNGIWKYFILVD